MDEQSPLPGDNEYSAAKARQVDPWSAPDAEAEAARQSAARIAAEKEAEAAAKTRRGIRWMLILIPLFLCLITSALGAVVAAPLRGQMQSGVIPRVPVTGADPQLAVTPESTAAPSDQVPSPLLGQTYREAAVDHLTTCMSSFHDFFIMEELAAHQPDVLQNDTWQTDVTQTMNSFREDCEKLGSLPDAPASFTELDRYLKLAASEVGPATDSFTSAMKSQQASDLRGSIRHMMRFVEYTQNAEAILSGMEQRREI